MVQQQVISPEMIDAIYNLGRNFLAQGQYEKALIIFEGLEALFPDDAQCSCMYGEALLLHGSIDQALLYFLRKKKQFPHHSGIMLTTARVYMMIHDHKQAHATVLPIIQGDIEASPLEQALAKSIFLASKNSLQVI